jgi:hypothetical protein
VVDAGAKGFVDFLEGILHFIKKGKLLRTPFQEIVWSPEETKTPSREKSLHNRYCSEALLTGTALDPERIREIVSRYGDSAVVAGSEERIRLHVHTNDPAGLFFEIKDAGAIAQIKVDDMKKQYEAAWLPKSKTAFVIDSTCDLPADWVDDRQIHVLPCLVTFGDQVFLDKLTISPDRLYGLLAEGDIRPKTAQPALKTVQNTLGYLAGHYESVIVLTVSDKLSGVYRTCRTAAAALSGKKISLVDGRNVSAGSGLLAVRASEMIAAGKSHDEVVAALESWVPKTNLYVDVQSMKYAVRSGRVSRVKGLAARILGLKPIIGISAEGRLEAAGKSFSRSGNLSGIVRTVEAAVRKRPLWGYGLVQVRNPERASLYAEKLTASLGRPPVFIVDADPAIGVHAGLGAVGVAVLYE